ncbi:MAG: IgGFc-binding protein [Myxococcota bacterium]|nr:IgGFc-binding protein [Myxococcota bacterium]
MRTSLTFSGLLALSIVATLATVGCDARTPPALRDSGVLGDGETPPPPTGCTAGGPSFVCMGNTAIGCAADGSETGRTMCTDMGQVCVQAVGCATCRPGSFNCDGNDVTRCNEAGTGYEPFMACDAAAGQMCNSTIGACTSLCDDAARSNSYIGCEYWPVTTLNSQVDATFSPAVVVANPQTMPATVTLSRGGSVMETRTVAAGATETIPIPWVNELKGTIGEEQSILLSGGSYRLQSNVPVTVYQFTPLEYEQGGEYSFSNDASLLLPAHVMTGNYTILSRPTLMLRQDGSESSSPGFATIVGVSETPVQVTVQFRGDVVAGPGVSAQGTGSSATYTLNQGDVLQLVGGAPSSCTVGDSETLEIPSPIPFFPPTTVTIDYCTVGDQYDLTGTEIRATGPVQVIGGHNCAFVPYNRWACDHLEEAMFPQDAWDEEAIVAKTQPPMGRTEPNIVRVLSGADGNAITFDPPSVASGRTLNRGEYMEFEASQSFRVTGTGPILVGQYLVGQDYAGYGMAGDMGEGDPAFSLAIPTEQYRTEYTFLAPSSYPTNFVSVTAPSGSTITLDGSPVSGFMPIGSTGYGTVQVPIGAGQHTISGDNAFGIVVYGFGSYTSYMYPGGLDLEAINPLI